MEDNTADLILTKLREFRATVTEWQQGMGERVSSIETTIKPAILGNGQPHATVEMTAIEPPWKTLRVSHIPTARPRR